MYLSIPFVHKNEQKVRYWYLVGKKKDLQISAGKGIVGQAI
jgi:hypothetical protein